MAETTRPGPIRFACAALLAAAGAVSAFGAAFAQDPPPPPDSLQASHAQASQEAETPDPLAVLPPDSAAARGPSTSGAFLRGVLLPGWGHAVSGSKTRGAFYFSAETLAGWMLFKTWRRLGAARDQVSLLEAELTAALAARGVTDLAEVEAALDEHERLAEARGLVDAREEQREDWIAAAIFALLVSGVDAFVSAHLKDFPEPLTIEGDPAGGRVEVGVRVPLGGR